MADDVYDVNTPRAYHHGDLRRALVEAGFEILEAEGREALTLRSVSDRTGVSKMAPYRHFADKAALLTAIGSTASFSYATDLSRRTSATTHARRLSP